MGYFAPEGTLAPLGLLSTGWLVPISWVTWPDDTLWKYGFLVNLGSLIYYGLLALIWHTLVHRVTISTWFAFPLWVSDQRWAHCDMMDLLRSFGTLNVIWVTRTRWLATSMWVAWGWWLTFRHWIYLATLVHFSTLDYYARYGSLNRHGFLSFIGSFIKRGLLLLSDSLRDFGFLLSTGTLHTLGNLDRRFAFLAWISILL